MSNNELPKIVLFDLVAENQLPADFNKLYHTHLYCYQGNISFTFNDQFMNCKAGQFLFWFAESKLSDLTFTKNFKATVLLVEKKFLNDNIPDQSWSINAQLHSRVYPVKEAISLDDRQRILINFEELNERFLQSGHRFYNEALNLQMQLFILEMWDIFANEYEQRRHSLQTGTLYEQFMQLLPLYCMHYREVQFYSAKLNITSKYLNYLCKVHSGTTASEWIRRYARERIIILLQNKNLNISEIADEMDFSSRSFFTRYVKKLLGMTPNDYRARLHSI